MAYVMLGDLPSAEDAIRALRRLAQVHRMSPSGRVMIVTDGLRARHHSPAHFANVGAGMLVDGRYTPPPWAENTFTAAW